MSKPSTKALVILVCSILFVVLTRRGPSKVEASSSNGCYCYPRVHSQLLLYAKVCIESASCELLGCVGYRRIGEPVLESRSRLSIRSCKYLHYAFCGTTMLTSMNRCYQQCSCKCLQDWPHKDQLYLALRTQMHWRETTQCTPRTQSTLLS